MLARLLGVASVVALPVLSHAAAFISDFNSGVPAGSAVIGNAAVDSGVLKVTSALNGQAGAFFVPNFTGGQSVTNFRVAFDLALGGGTCCGARMADGFSMNFAPDVTSSASPGEDGTGTGITVSFDTWDNNNDDTAPAVEIRYGGAIIAFQSFGTLGGALREGGRAPAGPVLSNSIGQEVQIFSFGPVPATPIYIPVVFELFSDNTFSLSYSNVQVWSHIPIPTYTPITGGNWDIGGRTGGANEDVWIDNLKIFANYNAGPASITSPPTNTSVIESQRATFSVAVNGTPPYFFQWLSNGVPIVGATSDTYTTPVTTTNMNGIHYSVSVSNALSGEAVVSSDAILTVNPGIILVGATTGGRTNQVLVTFTKAAKLTGTYTLNNGATVSTIGYGSSHNVVVLNTSPLAAGTVYTLSITGETGETDNSALVPSPSTVKFQQEGPACTDFASLPIGATLFGSAKLADDGSSNNPVLHLADDNQTGVAGAYYISNQFGNSTFYALNATWQTKIGGDLNGHADGYSFNWGNDVPAAPLGGAEEGAGSWLSCTIDTWDGGSGPDTGIEIKWKGNRVAFMHVPRTDEGDGNFLCRNIFLPTSVTLDRSGHVTFSYDTNSVSANLPNFTGIPGLTMSWAARTGGEADNFWMDNLCLSNYTLGAVSFVSQPVTTTTPETFPATFTTIVDGSPTYFYQWFTNGVPVPGATNSSYTTAPATAAMEGTLVSVNVSNVLNSITSSNATIHVALNPRVVSVSTRSDNEVHILYTRAVNVASGSYTFNNGLVEGDRTYGSNHSEVVIILDPVTPLSSGTTYQVQVQDVVSEAGGLVMAPNPTAFSFKVGFGHLCNDFEIGLSPGMLLKGNAYYTNNFVHLTDTANSLVSEFFVTDPNNGDPVDRLLIKYRLLLGSPSPGTRIADGISMVVASDVNTNTAIWSEEPPATTGLTVSFDTWDNASPDTAPAIEIRYKNIMVATQSMAGIRNDARPLSTPLLPDVNGNPLSLETSNQFVNVMLSVSPSGLLDLYYKDYVIFHNLQLPNYTPFQGANIAWAGRTGGANENAWIDDLCINAFAINSVSITTQPANAGINEVKRQGALFTVGVDGLPPYTVQWYSNNVALPGATALSYQTPVLDRSANNAGYYAVVSNVYSGFVTSSTARVTVTNLDVTAPSLSFVPVSSCAIGYTNVLLRFSEALNAATANNIANYTVAGAPVIGAVLQPDGRSVILTVATALNPYDNVKVTVNGVKDAGGFNTTSLTNRIAIHAIAQPNAQGMVVLEAEDFDNRTVAAGGHIWDFNTLLTGQSGFPAASGTYSGAGDMEALPNVGTSQGDGNLDSPRMDYCINFPTAGTNYIWVRYVGPTGSDNSLHMGIDGVQANLAHAIGNDQNNNRYEWTRFCNSNVAAQVYVPTAGVHTISVWMREDGARVDKILLTPDFNFGFFPAGGGTPDITDLGPAAVRTQDARPAITETRTNGVVTMTWPGAGWTLQATTNLVPTNGPAVWTDQPFQSPVVIPAGFFGTGQTNVFFRLIGK